MSASPASQALPRFPTAPTAIRSVLIATGDGDRILWSPTVPGFGLRARGGKATWVHQYRDGAGETCRLRSCAWPALSYAGALEAVQRNAARITLGNQPRRRPRYRSDIAEVVISSSIRSAGWLQRRKRAPARA